MTSEALEQPLFNYQGIADDDRGDVKERALRIRDAAKRTAEGIILIGQWLTEAKARLKHGQWLPWLEAEFGWSQPTAFNFMNVYKQLKLSTFDNLAIDVSALYLIAAPKTPEPVRQEVLKRAATGEKMTKAKAVAVLDSYKARAELPTPAVARKIAIATGAPTLANTNVYVPPVSKEEERKRSDEQSKIRGLYSAMGELASAGLTPEEMVRLGKKHACVELAERAQQVGDWLLSVAAAVGRADAKATPPRRAGRG